MRRRFFFLALLFLPILAAYWPVLGAGYTNWDDPDYTFNNPAVSQQTAANLLKTITSPRLGHYHPLTDLSLAAEAAVAGGRAGAHHAGNLLLHLANAALAFLLLALLLGSDWLALGGALLWALHPANAESAAWIAERKNLLYAFFYLLALLAYLRGREGWRRTALVFGLFLLALLAKASAVTLPLALLALDWKEGRPLDRRNLLEKAGLLAVAGLFTVIAAAAQADRGSPLPGNPVKLLSFYLLHSAWPLGLSALYPYKEALAELASSHLRYVLPALAFAGALALEVRRNTRLAAFGLLFFLVNILPFAVVIPIGPALAADRYLYLPLLGLVLAALAAAAWLWPAGARAKAAGAALLCLLIAAEAALTVPLVKTWRSSETLWTAVLERFPASETANLNLAQALLERGDPASAAPRLLAVLRANPDNADALYNLGTALARAGRPAEALPLLRRAAFLKPASAMAWTNLGLTLLALKQPDEARKAFLTSAAADPAYAPAQAGLAEAGRLARPARR